MNEEAIANAIDDLTRVVIALQMEGSKPEMVRRLHAVGIRPARIAVFLGMQPNHVTAYIAKAKTSSKKKVPNE